MRDTKFQSSTKAWDGMGNYLGGFPSRTIWHPQTLDDLDDVRWLRYRPDDSDGYNNISVAEGMILSRVLHLLDMRRGLEQEYPPTAEEVRVACFRSILVHRVKRERSMCCYRVCCLPLLTHTCIVHRLFQFRFCGRLGCLPPVTMIVQSFTLKVP